MVRIGIRYDLRSPHAGSPEARYAEILEHAAGAERAGVDVLWVAERPFVRDALLPAALPLCAALAERTEHSRIATGALPLPLHHPLRVAEDAASVDVLSGGRFELGVGLGEHSEGFDGFGIPIRERAGRFEEALEWVRRAWTEETVGGSGEHFEIAEVRVHPRPTQRPHPPIWIAGQAEATAARAVRLETGLLTDSRAAAEGFLAGWRASGRPAAEARIAWHLDADDARPERVAERIAEALGSLGPARFDVVLPAVPRGTSLAREAQRLPRLVEVLRTSFAA